MPVKTYHDVMTSYGGSIAVSVADTQPPFKVKGQAYVFDLSAKQMLREFPVRYELPGPRLGISRRDELLFAGCYNAYGIAAYRISDGAEVWRRKDLKSVQEVAAFSSDDFVFCGRETGAAHLLDAHTGATVEKFAGVKAMYPSPFDNSVIVAGRTLELHRPFGVRVTSFKRTEKFDFGCVFSDCNVVVAEGAALRCFDLQSGELQWTHSVPEVENPPHLCYHARKRAFVGIHNWCKAGPAKGATQLLEFEMQGGKILKKAPFCGGRIGEFCLRGEAVFQGSLLLHSTENGRLLRDFTTPALLEADPETSLERLRNLARASRSVEELANYMQSEGFLEGDIERAMILKISAERKAKQG